MRTTHTMTISLPPAMLRQFERVRRAENRTRSELVREALRAYFSSRFPEITPSQAALAAIRRGRAEIQRGEYVTFEGLLHNLAAANRKARAKETPKNSRG